MKKILILMLSGLMLTQGINAAQQQKSVNQLLSELKNSKAENFEQLRDWFVNNVYFRFAPNEGEVESKDFSTLARAYQDKRKEIDSSFNAMVTEVKSKIQNLKNVSDVQNFILKDKDALAILQSMELEEAFVEQLKKLQKEAITEPEIFLKINAFKLAYKGLLEERLNE
ncbi:MAG: hypothetical protein AB7R69_03225 [Candidatus Babeliales bacterium]